MREPRTVERGRIELICGCMFSGKSERLIELLLEARSQSISAAAFKHASDDRYAAGQIVTHSGRRCEAIPVHSPRQILERAGDARLILIDEAQFFDDEVVVVCAELAGQGRSVIVAGLDRDSWGLPFGPMPRIEAIADSVTHTHGVCSGCGGQAEFTQRLAPLESQSMIGGPEAYEPRCARCFQPPPIELRR